MAVGACGMIRSAVPPGPTFSILILAGLVWLGSFLPLQCRAEESVVLGLDSVEQLRQLVGSEGVGIQVGEKIYWWDRRDMSGVDEDARVRPGFAGVAGGWRQQNEPVAPDVGGAFQPASCRAPVVLEPQQTGELTARLLKAAVAEGAVSGCPVIVAPGIHPIDRDIFISTDGATLFCKPGAIFKKTRTANVFWFKGKGIRMSGRCEIDGAGYSGSGLIVDFSAQDTKIEHVYAHDHGGHGVLNRGAHTLAEYVRTERNGKIGFANDAAKDVDIRYLLSRENGNEGLTIDNPGVKSVRIVGGLLEGNCCQGGVGNIGVDAAEDVVIEGIIVQRPQTPCSWNLTAQNNVGNTDRLTIRGGYFSGARKGDIHFRSNVERGFIVRDSVVTNIVSRSNGHPVLIDAGGERNSVSVQGYSGRIVVDLQ